MIDDQKSVRDALGEMLSVFGFEVETYASADNFLAAHAARRLHRGRCAHAWHRRNGLTRELARRKISLPVVLISGHGDVPMAVAAIKAGAEDFIEKPVDDVQLIAAINRGMARLFEQRSQQKSSWTLVAQFARLTPRKSRSSISLPPDTPVKALPRN